MTGIARRLAGRGLRRYAQGYHDRRDEPLAVQRFRDDDAIIGFYQNPPGSTPPVILITDDGLSFPGSADMPRIDYAEISALGFPDRVDSGPRRIRVRLNDGRDVQFSIDGRDGKYQDIAYFTQFLLRAVSHVRGERVPNIEGLTKACKDQLQSRGPRRSPCGPIL